MPGAGYFHLGKEETEMKRSKKLLILGLVLLLLTGGTLAASHLNLPQDAQEETVTATTIFTLNPESVQSVQWEYSENLTFDREDGSWAYRDSSAFPVDGSYLDAILEALSQVESYKTIETIENWDTYGLEIPVCTISIAAEETYDLAIGIETTLGGQRYFSIGDGKVYLVDSAILEPFQYGLYDLMAAQQMPQVTQVTAMEVTTPEGSYSLRYDPDSGRTYCDEDVWFWEDTALDTGEATSLIGVVTQLSLSQCESYDAQSLSPYGLDAPDLTVTIYDSGEKAYTLPISAPKNGSCYVQLPGTNMVYAIDDAIYDTLRYTTQADLVPRDVLRMDWDTVDSLTATLDGSSYTFTSSRKEITTEEETTTETLWLLNKEEVALSEVLTTLTGLSATGLATGLTPQGDALIQLQINRTRDTFGQITLALYPYSSDNCLVTLDGAPTVTVSRQEAAQWVESFRELLEN